MGLPNTAEIRFFEYCLAQRVWRGFGFGFFSGLPNGPEIRFLSTASPNGSGGVSDFFQWSAQRARDLFFKYCLAQRVWRGFGFVFQVLVCPTGPRFVFLSTGLPNTAEIRFFKHWFAQRVWQGCQSGYTMAL